MRRWGSKAPWFAAGVPFTCVPDCGKCCDQPGGVVFLRKTDAARIAKHLEMPVDLWLARDCTRSANGRYVLKSREEDGICIYLNADKTCQIHTVKPDQCRAFPWWRENMESTRAWRKTVDLCPGLRQPSAPVIPLPVIQGHLDADAKAEIGFRVWQASDSRDAAEQ